MELAELEFWVQEAIKYKQTTSEEIEELC